MKRDKHRRILFCPQQSAAAYDALNLAGIQDVERFCHIDNIAAAQKGDSVLVLGSDGKLRDRSAAALRAGVALGGGWALISKTAALLPSTLLDAIYDWVGKNRYKWFGINSTCRVPTSDERSRFL